MATVKKEEELLTKETLLKQWNILIFLPLIIIGVLDDLMHARSISRFIIQSFTIACIFYTKYIFNISLINLVVTSSSE